MGRAALKISAASASVSDRVGCGWMVRARSSARAPISMARAISLISLSALRPVMPAPRIRPDLRIGQQLGAAVGHAHGLGPAGVFPGEFLDGTGNVFRLLPAVR